MLTGIFVVLVSLSVILGVVGLLQLRTAASPMPTWLQMWTAFLGLFTNQVPSWVDAQPATPVTLQLAQFIAPFATGYVFVTSAAVILSERWRFIRARLARHHAIVIGGGRRGVLISRSLSRSGAPVVLVDLAAASERVAAALLKRTIPLSGDPIDDSVLRRAGIDRGRELFAVSDDSEMNASIVISARRLRTRSGSFTCYALISDSDLHAAVEARQLSMPSAQNFRVSLIDKNQVIARGLVESASPLQADTILVVGDGGLARSLTIEVMRTAISAAAPTPMGSPTPPRIAVAGPEADTLVESARRSAVGTLWGDRPLAFLKSELRALWKGPALGDLVTTATRAVVFVCAPRDDESLRLAFAVLRQAGDVAMDVVVAVETSSGFAGAFAADGVRIFDDVQGALRVIASSDYVGSAANVRAAATNERMARALHATYLAHMRSDAAIARDPQNVVEWDDLPARIRDSNRSQAWDIGQKLSLLGCVIMPVVGPARDYPLTPDDIELLSEAEHVRWSEEARGSGLVYGPTRTDRTHPDLVSWRELSEEAREKDRIFMRELPSLLAREGYEIVKFPA